MRWLREPGHAGASTTGLPIADDCGCAAAGRNHTNAGSGAANAHYRERSRAADRCACA
jgi:hypothetical protein